MTLRVTASPPEIEVTDEDGHKVLDTDASLFHVTDILQGSQALGQRNAPVNSDAVHTLGSCHADSTFVRGAMRINSSTVFMPTAGLWFNVGGSFVQLCTGDALRFLTIIASGGVVQLHDTAYIHVIKNGVGQVLSDLPAMTVDYFLYVGRFSP